MKHFIFMKTKLGILLLFLSSAIFSQTNIYFGQKDLTFPQKGGIYETGEDLINDTIKDVGVYNQDFDKLKMGFQQAAHAGEINFGETYYKLKGAKFFGYKDDRGNRHRIVNGDDFIVLSAGSKWLYSNYYGYKNRYIPTRNGKPQYLIADKNYEAKFGKKIEKYAAYSDIRVWYSNGTNTAIMEIKKWDKTPSKEANEKLFMDDAEISKQYMSDVSDSYDPNHDDGCMDQLERIIHSTDLYNKKHPK